MGALSENWINGFRVIDDGRTSCANYVWDTGTLTWVVQSGGGSGPSSDVNVTNASLAVTQAGAWSVGITGSVAVTGPLTDTQLRATPVPVSGTFFQATQPVSIAASVAVTGPLTDTQLRATPVPVSGTFFQATQPVSIAASVAVTQSGAWSTGRTWALGSGTDSVALPYTTAASFVSVRLTDGSAFYTAGGGGGGNLATAAKGTTTAGNPTSENTDANTQSLHTRITNASIAVTGSFFQATQPVSIAASVAVTGPLTDAQLRASAVPVSLASTTITGSVAVTGPLTDTQLRASAVPVTAAQATAANLNATVVQGNAGSVAQSWFARITDATNTAAVKAASTAAAAADPSLVVALSPNSNGTEATNDLAVTATAATGVAVTLTIPAVAGQFARIKALEINAYSTAARTGGATPVVVTSTNLPGSPAWTFATAAAIGTTDRDQYFYGDGGLRSSTVNTATTIVCPAITGVIWRVNAVYRNAP